MFDLADAALAYEKKEWRGVWVVAARRAEPRACPPDPSLHVQPKPGGGQCLTWFLLIKPGRTGNEPDEGLMGYR